MQLNVGFSTKLKQWAYQTICIHIISLFTELSICELENSWTISELVNSLTAKF